MNYLLHMDAFCALFRQDPLVKSRSQQHQGELYLATVTITLVELWLTQHSTPFIYLSAYQHVMKELVAVNLDEPIAHRAAVLRRPLASKGAQLELIDLFVVATAIENAFTLVTHDTHLFALVPGLALADWTIP